MYLLKILRICRNVPIYNNLPNSNKMIAGFCFYFRSHENPHIGWVYIFTVPIVAFAPCAWSLLRVSHIILAIRRLASVCCCQRKNSRIKVAN